jgi:hypothetical protein
MKDFGQYGIIPIEYAVILDNLADYKSPKDKVSRLEKSEVLIRLKKGLYVISPDVSNRNISSELIANHLYGPSYISFESALSFHGMIPERTYTMKSATTKRRKNYQTPFGNYEYFTVPEIYFSIGLQQKIIQNSYAFIIAGPEKAICDLIISTSGLRFQSKKAIDEYLRDDLRIDFEGGIGLKPEIIEECAKYGYKKTELSFLSEVLTSTDFKNA